MEEHEKKQKRDNEKNDPSKMKHHQSITNSMYKSEEKRTTKVKQKKVHAERKKSRRKTTKSLKIQDIEDCLTKSP